MFLKINKFIALSCCVCFVVTLHAGQVVRSSNTKNPLILMGVEGLRSYDALLSQLKWTQTSYMKRGRRALPPLSESRIVIFSVCPFKNIKDVLPPSSFTPRKGVKIQTIVSLQHLKWYLCPIRPYLQSIEDKKLDVGSPISEFINKHGYFDKILSEIHRELMSKTPTYVVVNCIHGASRSLGTVAAYLMRYNSISLKAAFEKLAGQNLEDYKIRYGHTVNFVKTYEQYLKKPAPEKSI